MMGTVDGYALGFAKASPVCNDDHPACKTGWKDGARYMNVDAVGRQSAGDLNDRAHRTAPKRKIKQADRACYAACFAQGARSTRRYRTQ